ncbi:hypothetical protein SLE2022_015880 [Rubroshorea leprosula]
MRTDKPFEFEEIFEATKGFCEENKLGEGGFAKVYKGKLRGQEVAIKRLLNGPSKQDDSAFKNEVDLVARLQHPNLVRFYGSCSQRNERLLIFELASNGSLYDFLFDPSKSWQLDWEKRTKIIRGVASGLHYLHNNCPKMIHRDLKASNILLDKDMNPKIAGFGSAEHFKGDKSQVTASKVIGTHGYMPPEYAINQQNSIKLDVFSFGVLMLEIVSGERVSFDSGFKMKLLSDAWGNWKKKTISEFIDPNLKKEPRTDKINSYIQIGLLCVQEYEHRPKMDSVVGFFDCSPTNLPVPKPHQLLVKQEGDRPPDFIPWTDLVITEISKWSTEILEWPKKDNRRFLNVMCRVRNLDRSIKFYTECFGMKLLRKLDIPEKYSNAFLGFGPGKTNFVVELTYNYGVTSYDIGTGFGHFAIATPGVYKLVEEIRAKGGNVTREPRPVEGGSNVIAFVKDPDGYTFELIQRENTPEPLCQVMLRVGDLERSIKFYEKALGMRVVKKVDRPEYKYTIAMLGYAEEEKTTVLELTYNYGVTKYTKGNAYAQVAISTDDVYKSAEVVDLVTKEHGGEIIRQPGINTKVTSFLDPDGWKTVLVDNEDFLRELDKPRVTL